MSDQAKGLIILACVFSVMFFVIFDGISEVIKDSDERDRMEATCHKLFSVFQHQVRDNRLFCKVDYKWVEVKGEIE